MIVEIKKLDTEITTPIKEFYNSRLNTVVCTKCRRILEFENEDINRSKSLPHIKCTCGNSIQLHSKYLKLEREKFFGNGLNMIIYEEVFNQQDIIESLFGNINYDIINLDFNCFENILSSDKNLIIVNTDTNIVNSPRLKFEYIANNIDTISRLNSENYGKCVIFIIRLNKTDFDTYHCNNLGLLSSKETIGVGKSLLYMCKSILLIRKVIDNTKYIVAKDRNVEPGRYLRKEDIY